MYCVVVIWYRCDSVCCGEAWRGVVVLSGVVVLRDSGCVEWCCGVAWLWRNGMIL